MADLDNMLAVEAQPKKAVTDLCQEDAERMFATYRDRVQSEGKSVIYGQLIQMKVECAAADEIRLVSHSEITDSYAQSLRNDLIESFSAEAGRPVRVTSEFREDPNAAQDIPVVLSKQEMYEAMARKNPMIAQLKDGLNLQIDY
jgi:hypothetical protein